MTTPKNILGGELEACCTDPMTGFGRDGYCHTNDHDSGTHVVCAQVTEVFLQFTLKCGNDLITPVPERQFPGLRGGDFWCLCALRWLEAHEAGLAPPIKVRATHERALEYISKRILLAYRID